ncbi:hypothetical protein IMZ48_45700 [Candidatus Bathyarchaeota archaeon]|nr:hypothetical protein [Candidatus Bathyarchaeota archaeon]
MTSPQAKWACVSYPGYAAPQPLKLKLIPLDSAYEELSVFGILRKVEKLGPWSTYLRLLGQWMDRPGMTPKKIAEKTMHFYRF